MAAPSRRVAPVEPSFSICGFESWPHRSRPVAVVHWGTANRVAERAGLMNGCAIHPFGAAAPSRRVAPVEPSSFSICGFESWPHSGRLRRPGAWRRSNPHFLFAGSNPGLIVRGQSLWCTGVRRIEWRRGRDSNPRYGVTVYLNSNQAPSTTRPPLRRGRKPTPRAAPHQRKRRSNTRFTGPQ